LTHCSTPQGGSGFSSPFPLCVRTSDNGYYVNCRCIERSIGRILRGLLLSTCCLPVLSTCCLPVLSVKASRAQIPQGFSLSAGCVSGSLSIVISPALPPGIVNYCQNWKFACTKKRYFLSVAGAFYADSA